MTTIPAFSDNWIHMVEYEPGRALVVDPGECRGVLKMLDARSLELTTVLVTHHHVDHVGGVLKLKNKTACEVVGPEGPRMHGVDNHVADGDRLEVGPAVFEVIATPGHTLSSVCYYSSDLESDGVVFTGDTLFIGGCGRLFEGSAEQMYRSLTRLVQLPDPTRVYCGHDYTAENLAFGATVEPENDCIQTVQKQVRSEPLTCSTVGQEKQLNVFVRADSSEEFARRRRLKDRF